jgi:hypothetical protein
VAFTEIELPAFQQIFEDIWSLTLPFICRKVVTSQIYAEIGVLESG